MLVTKTGDQFTYALRSDSSGELPVVVSHKHHAMTLKNDGPDGWSSVTYQLKVPEHADILGWGMDHSEPSIWHGIFDYQNYGHGWTGSHTHKRWISETDALLSGGPEHVTVYKAWVLYAAPKHRK